MLWGHNGINADAPSRLVHVFDRVNSPTLTYLVKVLENKDYTLLSKYKSEIYSSTWNAWNETKHMQWGWICLRLYMSLQTYLKDKILFVTDDKMLVSSYRIYSMWKMRLIFIMFISFLKNARNMSYMCMYINAMWVYGICKLWARK